MLKTVYLFLKKSKNMFFLQYAEFVIILCGNAGFPKNFVELRDSGPPPNVPLYTILGGRREE